MDKQNKGKFQGEDRLKENIMNERMPLMDSFNLFMCGSNTSAYRVLCNGCLYVK